MSGALQGVTGTKSCAEMRSELVPDTGAAEVHVQPLAVHARVHRQRGPPGSSLLGLAWQRLQVLWGLGVGLLAKERVRACYLLENGVEQAAVTGSPPSAGRQGVPLRPTRSRRTCAHVVPGSTLWHTGFGSLPRSAGELRLVHG